MKIRNTLLKAVGIPAAFWCALPVAAAEIAPDALDSLPPADVLVLGEVHDNPVHHLNQARAVAAADPAALVFEMLTPEQAAAVTPALVADAAALEAALGWNASGWPDFAMYHPIFAAAGEAAIYGAALPRDAVRRAFAEGAAGVFGAEAGRFGLDLPLEAGEQAEREAAQFDAHCEAMPMEMMGGMVEAQRLRDAALARAALQALAETGGPVAVITGNGHARNDWGLVRAVLHADPAVAVFTLGQFESVPDAPPPFDAWLVTDPAARDDPCAALTGG